LVHTATHLARHPDLGREKARTYLQQWETKLNNGSASVYDYTKLAQVVISDLADANWGSTLLATAKTHASDHYALAHIAHLTAETGDTAAADALYLQAAAACKTADACLQLQHRLKSYLLPDAQLRAVYTACGNNMTTPADKLRWVEGIDDGFRDKTWASQAYAAIAADFSGADQARFEQSRRSRVGNALYPYRRHAA
jgi:hypothetical protein